MTDIVVVTGLSGAGRSTAANVLEDRGWFKIDNLPPRLVAGIVELLDAGPAAERIALGVGSGAYAGEVATAVAELRNDPRVDTVTCLFLDASTEMLVRRFESTRRRHPRDDGADGLEAVIERERELLSPARAEADLVIDTTDLSIHQLRERVVESLGRDDDERMHVSVVSFGYKYGLPRDVEMVFDCRFLPNPYWEERLRSLTGRDEEVRRFVLERPEAKRFVEDVDRLLVPLLPAFEDEGKSYLTVAFGCTGGRHRSVSVAEEVAQRLRAVGYSPSVTHRDVER